MASVISFDTAEKSYDETASGVGVGGGGGLTVVGAAALGTCTTAAL
jgi:hypothetical protein